MRLLGRFLSQEAWFLASSTVNFGRFFFLKKSYDEVWWFFLCAWCKSIACALLICHLFGKRERDGKREIIGIVDGKR